MRQRNIKKAKETILNNPELIYHEELDKKYLNEFLKRDNLCFEIGCGKGQFMYKLASNNLDNNYLAIEIKSSVIYKLLQKQLENKLDNLFLVNYNAFRFIDENIKDNMIKNMYLNFSDPWPKSPNKRLTSKQFLDLYYKKLVDNGKLFIKTDSFELYEFSLEQAKEKYNIIKSSTDLHKENYFDNNYTEYEQKFMLDNKNIYYIELEKKTIA